MDSNEQNSISGVLKILNMVLVLLISFMFIVAGNSEYINMRCIKNEESNTVFNEIRPDTNIQVSLNEQNHIENRVSSINVFRQTMTNSFNVNIDGYSIGLIDNTFGYLESIEKRYSVLQEICNSYINELGLDPKNIVEINIYGNIKSTAEKNRVSELKESGEIAKEIYNASVINDDLSALQLKVKVSEVVTIEPSIVFDTSDELYMGESAKIEGVEGRSIVYKEIVCNGLSTSDEKIIGEDIIKPVVNTVIKTGTKNPYNAGIAFLYKPTTGGYMSSKYGEIRATSVHKGIDIANNLGADVNCALEGKVISAGYNNGGYGNLIIIEHENNMKTYYAHLSKIYVKEGEEIKKGSLIGTIGSTGRSTGPHLHFELRVNGNPVDPTAYILK